MIPVLQVFMVLLLVGWPAYNLVVAFIGLRGTRDDYADQPLPDLRFWILIPALNEERVIARTVGAALALDGPDTPIRVLVVDDGSIDGTPDILRGIRDRRLHVLRRDLPDARQGKGAALNAGYQHIRRVARQEGTVGTTVVGIIDGDGRGDARMLHRVGSLLRDPKVGAVQCRVRIHNRSRLLGLLQDIEFASIANASQSLRDRLGTVGMGGNGQFARLSALEQLGPTPWSSCLVEDLELGLRLHLAGVHIRYTSTAATSQQAVVDLRRLVRQRTRWAQGNLQCARYIRPLAASRRISSTGLLDFVYYLLSPWVTAPLTLVVAGAMGLAGFGLATGETFGGLMAGGADTTWALGLWVGVGLLPGLMWSVHYWWRVGEEPLWRCLVAGLCYPVFLVLGVVSTWRALARHISGRHTWAKTERVAETSQPGDTPLIAS